MNTTIVYKNALNVIDCVFSCSLCLSGFYYNNSDRSFDHTKFLRHNTTTIKQQLQEAKRRTEQRGNKEQTISVTGQEDRLNKYCVLINPQIFQEENLDLIQILLHAVCQVKAHLKPITSDQRPGHLALHSHNWVKIALDQWGKRSQVRADLHPTSEEGARDTSHELSEGATTVGGDLHANRKGGDSSCSHTLLKCFISLTFPISKKDGTKRPIIDLRELNKCIHWEHFKMEGIHLIQLLLEEGDWMVKLDLKDTYFAVPICPQNWTYLTFQFRGSIYQFECLPFGLSSAPRIFKKVMKPVTSWLRQFGCMSDD